jgi:tRNA A58 N-methylase Trm61
MLLLLKQKQQQITVDIEAWEAQKRRLQTAEWSATSKRAKLKHTGSF